MTAILKVDTIQDTAGNNIINENTNTITIGKAGDTVNLAAGATAAGFGKVLQVSNFVQASSNQEISSTSYTDLTSITFNITPSSTSNKILLLSTIGVQLNSSTEGYGMQYIRDTTTIYSTKASYSIYSGASTESHNVNSFIYLDSPNSTSSLAYKVQVRGFNTNTVRFNDGYNSNIIAMEIAG